MEIFEQVITSLQTELTEIIQGGIWNLKIDLWGKMNIISTNIVPKREI